MPMIACLIAFFALLSAGLPAAQQGQDINRRFGTNFSGSLGYFLSTADFNYDGVGDVVAREISPDGVGVFDSATSGMSLIEYVGGSWLEHSLHSGDIDLDGIPDVLVGGYSVGYPWSDGYLYAYYGAIGQRTERQILKYSGPYATGGRIIGNVQGDAELEIWDFSEVGSSGLAWVYDFSGDVFIRQFTGGEACGLGDANGDGYDEFAVIFGSSVQLWFGGNPLPPYPQWQVAGLGGALDSIIGLGDLNGDGWPEIVAGDSAHNGTRGGLIVLSGLDGSELARFEGNVGYQVGTFHALASGDLDGDGHYEIIAGTPFADPNARTDAGGVYLLDYVAGSPTLATLQFIGGDVAGDQFGKSVAFLGDTNSNGRNDYAASAPYADPYGVTSAGAIYVLEGSGSTAPVLTGPATAAAGSSITLHMYGARPGDYCLWLAATNRNGSTLFGELLEIGAPQYLMDIQPISLLGSATLVLQLPLQLPPSVYLENLLLIPHSGPNGDRETTNSIRVRIQ